jgi:FkbM family methyltransferase
MDRRSKIYMKTFIEIGTCDFDTNLPLIESGEWKGIMCEPAPLYFGSLKKKCETAKNFENLILENIAISDYNGQVEFAVARNNLVAVHSWQRGISSVVSDHHKGERLFDYHANKNLIAETIEVPCLTLDDLIHKHKVESIDYLKIDAEGHEMNIIDAYSWKIKPTLIKLEHTHIDDIHIANLLQSKGYIVYTEQRDIYAIV